MKSNSSPGAKLVSSAEHPGPARFPLPVGRGDLWR